MLSSAHRFAAVLLLILGCAPRSAPVPAGSALLTHGIAAGDVNADSAVVWGRCNQAGTLSVRWQAAASSTVQTATTEVNIDHDLIGKVALRELQPGTTYTYRVWCGGNESAARDGRFSTAPAAERATLVRFAFGGDLGGQNACRDRQRGYPVFHAIRDRSPDFFIALGDLIYADDPCKAVGRYGNPQIAGPPKPAVTRESFREYWKYNREDIAFRQMLATTSMYSVWDDHEIKNDAGPNQDTVALEPGVHLMPPALDAYLEYQPMLPPSDTPIRFFSSRRWGKHLELFILDLRQYRDSNFAPDSAERPKTMLGLEQRRWFLDALQRSDATWKVVVSSVPLSLPTGTELIGHDGWTGFGVDDGFEHERQMILEATRSSQPRNFLWITTDVHFGAVFRYRPFADDPRFVFHEMISGPLTAGVFPKDEYDHRLGAERLFMYGPKRPIADFDEAMGWFNFGLIEIDADGKLSGKLINGRGESVYALTLETDRSQ